MGSTECSLLHFVGFTMVRTKLLTSSFGAWDFTPSNDPNSRMW